MKKYEELLTDAHRELMDRQAIGAEGFERAGLAPPPPIPHEPLPEFAAKTKGKEKSRPLQAESAKNPMGEFVTHEIPAK